MNKNIIKGIGIGFFIILLSVIAMYLGLAYYYAGGFSYGTWINGVYCTGKSVNEVNEELLRKCNYEGLTIIDGDGKSYIISAEEVCLTFDFDEALNAYYDRQNPYLWIDNLIGNAKDAEIKPVVEYDETIYEKTVSELPFFHGTSDDDRILKIVKGNQGYYLVNERSHVLDEERAK